MLIDDPGPVRLAADSGAVQVEVETAITDLVSAASMNEISTED